MPSGADGALARLLATRDRGTGASDRAIVGESAAVLILFGWVVTRAVRTWSATRAPGAPRLTRADRAAFERTLRDLHRAWTLGDLDTLAGITTPELLGLLTGRLREDGRLGVRNSTGQIRIRHCELAEAWVEDGVGHAIVAWHYTMIDCTTDDTGRVLEGDPTLPRECRDRWSFRREPGGAWRVGAIQQV